MASWVTLGPDKSPYGVIFPLHLQQHLLLPRGIPWRKLEKLIDVDAYGLHDRLIPYKRETMKE